MSGTVLDYSAGFPGATAIRAAGHLGAVRYIGSPGNRKCATKAELDDFARHGLGMALVFEQDAGDWRGGYSAGQVNMRRAVEHAFAIGWPVDSWRPIYMAVDQDVVTAEEFDQVRRYLEGAATVVNSQRVGVYGEYDVCEMAYRQGYRWLWQCRAWSGTPIKYHGARRLFQRVGTTRVGGVDCDINEVNTPDWGQHNYVEDGGLMAKLNEDEQREVLDLLRSMAEGKEGVRNAGTQFVGESARLAALAEMANEAVSNTRITNQEIKKLQVGGLDYDKVATIIYDGFEDFAQKHAQGIDYEKLSDLVVAKMFRRLFAVAEEQGVAAPGQLSYPENQA